MSQIGIGSRLGDWYAHCQVCAGRYFGSTMKGRWDGLFVCTKCYEPRNQADIPVIIKDIISPPRVSTMRLTETLNNTEYDGTTNWYNDGNTIT